LAPYAAILAGWVDEVPDITMPELAAKLRAEHGVVAHPASLSKFLIKQGFSFKKKHCWRPKPVAMTWCGTAGSGE
jgi:transposase